MGGWTNYSDETSKTKLTPAVVSEALDVLALFESRYNDWVHDHDLDTSLHIEGPAGSTTYYLRDLRDNPEREYGDIDIDVSIVPDYDKTNAQRFAEYRRNIVAFIETTKWRTDNGVNIIIETSHGAVQVDLMFVYFQNSEWTEILHPEYNIKGVVSASIMSSFAKVFDLSFGAHGIQVKLLNGKPIPFNKRPPDSKLVTISVDPYMWGQDVVEFFHVLDRGSSLPLDIIDHPGFQFEQRCNDLIDTIIDVVNAFERYGLCGVKSADRHLIKIGQELAKKIDDAINSSKFDKASTPEQIEKAERTKQHIFIHGTRFIRALG